jgi:hypothetical protein
MATLVVNRAAAFVGPNMGGSERDPGAAGKTRPALRDGGTVDNDCDWSGGSLQLDAGYLRSLLAVAVEKRQKSGNVLVYCFGPRCCHRRGPVSISGQLSPHLGFAPFQATRRRVVFGVPFARGSDAA